jgi:polyether ionophore transport system permease protein
MSPDAGDLRAARTVLVTTAKRAARGGALWGVVFGLLIASSATSYVSAFPDAASRAEIASTIQGNAGFEALFGIIRGIDTVAGYTAYKTLYTMIILGAIWGLLASTRLLRGEEDAGRWELYLSGHTTRGAAAAQAAIGLGIGIVALWVPIAVIAAAAGASAKVGIGVSAAVYLAASASAAAAMFMAAGMLLGQLSVNRHEANLIGAAVLAGAYLIRMVADSAPELGWLRWASPFGWVEELRPLTGSHPFAFVPIVTWIVVLVSIAIAVASRRDLGAGAIAGRDTPRARTLLLGGEAGLTLRLTWPAIVAWLVAMSVTGLVFGLVAEAASGAIRSANGIQRAIQRLGGSSAGAASYLGFVFLVAAGLVAISVAGQISAARTEEAEGHLDNLLVRPVARWRWLGFRLAVAAGLVVLASALVGVTAWIGAASQDTGVGFGELLKAGLNVAPPAIFVLGIGGLAFGLWPRGAVGVVYGLVVWSFLVETISAVVDSNHWLRDTSPVLHIAPVPAAEPNVTAAAWLLGLGVLAAVAGIAAFGRRDLAGA